MASACPGRHFAKTLAVRLCGDFPKYLPCLGPGKTAHQHFSTHAADRFCANCRKLTRGLVPARCEVAVAAPAEALR
jgi:hypothetical protein